MWNWMNYLLPRNIRSGASIVLGLMLSLSLTAEATADIRGYQDGFDGDIAQGWACDDANLSRPIDVHLYEGSTFVAGATAALTREPAVAQKCGGVAAHGFRIKLPSRFRDGVIHQISAYAIGLDLKTVKRLNPQQQSYRFVSVVSGYHDGFNGNIAQGWACDAADPRQPLIVQFFEGITNLGWVTANEALDPAVGTRCNGVAAHSFRFALPDWLKDGGQHVITAKAVGLDGRLLTLAGTPRTYTSPPAKPPRLEATLFTQPSISGANVGSYIFANPATRPDKFTLGLYQAGSKIVENRVNWDTLAYTGLRTDPDPARRLYYQRGQINAAGETVATLKGVEAAFVINGKDQQTASPLIVGSVHREWSAANAPQPWPTNGSLLRTRYYLQVPTATPNSCNYVAHALKLLDRKSGGRFNLVTVAFDQRGRAGIYGSQPEAYGAPFQGEDAIISTAHDGASNVGSPIAGSTLLQLATWTGWKRFEWQISVSQLQRAISMARAGQPAIAWSVNPADYVLLLANVHTEINVDNTVPPCTMASNARRIGSAMKNLTIERYSTQY